MSEQLEREDRRGPAQARASCEDTIRGSARRSPPNLDRDALLEIGVRTAVDAVRGRRRPRAADRPPRRRLHGAADASRRRSPAAAERRALRRAPSPSCSTRGATARRGAAVTAATTCTRSPCRSRARVGRGARSAGGVISIARRGRPFDERRARALRLPHRPGRRLARERRPARAVQRQAVTDELTGLSNHAPLPGRCSTREVERLAALRAAARPRACSTSTTSSASTTPTATSRATSCCARSRACCATCSRDIDEPARYGGEEMAVVLPQTDLAGAELLAERMRAAVGGTRDRAPGRRRRLR